MYTFDSDNDKLHFILVVTAHILEGVPMESLMLKTYTELLKKESKVTKALEIDAEKMDNCKFALWVSSKLSLSEAVSPLSLKRLEVLLDLVTSDSGGEDTPPPSFLN